ILPLQTRDREDDPSARLPPLVYGLLDANQPRLSVAVVERVATPHLLLRLLRVEVVGVQEVGVQAATEELPECGLPRPTHSEEHRHEAALVHPVIAVLGG